MMLRRVDELGPEVHDARPLFHHYLAQHLQNQIQELIANACGGCNVDTDEPMGIGSR
jgi:hypothetical protein